jgi:hypothetical protein
MMRVDGAWKHAEAVRDPRGPIWPSATSIPGFLPELRRFQDDFRPRAREGVGWGEVSQVRHDACRWSLETCRGCAGPPGPDLAKRDLNPRIPARVTTISGRCGGARARKGVGWGEVSQVRHDACRWSLETCRGCAGPPGPDLAKRDLNPRIPARVTTISGRFQAQSEGGCWMG